MNLEVRESLDKLILDKISVIDDGNLSIEDEKALVEDVTKLYNLRIEDEKNHLVEETNRVDLLKTYITNGVLLGTTVLSLGFYGYWMSKGLKFEESGSFTSQTFRGLISRFPKK